jgi:hypothetical protein
MTRRALLLGLTLVCAAPAAGQQLLDRVVARVGQAAITLTDVRAAVGLGIVDPGTTGGDPQDEALQAVIDRYLVLEEVARFPPPEPEPGAVDALAAEYRKTAGTRLEELMRSTGLDDERLREMARDTLRIQAYLDQRFGTAVQVSDAEVREYFRTHPGEFTRAGMPLSFEEAAPLARDRASAARRQATIARWVADLRSRADIVQP